MADSWDSKQPYIYFQLPRCSFCRKEFLNTIDQQLSEEEARDLCFYLDIDYENLVGQGKRGKIRELVLFVKRKGKVNEFMGLFTEERSQIIIECSHT